MFKDNEALTPHDHFYHNLFADRDSLSVGHSRGKEPPPPGRKGAAATPGRCRCEHRYVRGSGGTSPDRSLLLPLAAFGSSLSSDKVYPNGVKETSRSPTNGE